MVGFEVVLEADFILPLFVDGKSPPVFTILVNDESQASRVLTRQNSDVAQEGAAGRMVVVSDNDNSAYT
ncbi:hypothetical protein Asbog_00444 [Asaia bogorensis NBRC 16594]|nr:hypothetical protein [Asaia bogorensis]BAT18753.1 hypothetical protein Asbog_00444 [Asaia bogorensis NBRC 16594]